MPSNSSRKVKDESRDGDQAGEEAIAGLYRGPLADFVGRRDALAKELRASGERESASAVKALRKPSRVAWALNLVVLEQPGLLDALQETVRGALEMSGKDLRAAIGAIRDAVREFANRASQIAGSAGQDVEADTLASALTAVLGTAESFEQLQQGRLTDIPESGGLDLLGSLQSLPPARPSPPSKTTSPPAKSPPAGSKSGKEKAEEQRQAAARGEAEKSAAALVAARERAVQAQRALDAAEAAVVVAEDRMRQAETAARDAKSKRDDSRREADAAAAALDAALAAAERADQELKQAAEMEGADE